jgi:hypothetical protein
MDLRGGSRDNLRSRTVHNRKIRLRVEHNHDGRDSLLRRRRGRTDPVVAVLICSLWAILNLAAPLVLLYITVEALGLPMISPAWLRVAASASSYIIFLITRYA